MDKRELVTKIIDIEFEPDLTLESNDISKLPTIPIKKLATLGSSITPFCDLLASLFSNGKSGVYYVQTGGKRMFKSGGEFIGSLAKVNNQVGGGQARMTKIPLSPVGIANLCTVMAIEHKLNEIQQKQQSIIDFLVYKETAKIKGNINTLTDILNNYKYNIDNNMYRNNKHILVQDIKRDSEQSLVLVDKLLSNSSKEKLGIHFDKKVETYLDDVVYKLNDYELSLYQLSFSSLLEILLLENFEEAYIDSQINNIKMHVDNYERLYYLIKDQVKHFTTTSIQTTITKGVSMLSRGIGVALNKSIIGKTNIDKKLVTGGENLDELVTNKIDSKTKLLSKSNSDLVEPFIKTIETIKSIYKDEYILSFDSDNIYLNINIEENNSMFVQ